jgi:hypothetical protein
LIERLLENWLIRANERSFQIPFCQSLAYEGHTVVHLSRHCAMEMGKDILTIAPDDVPCAYQLKGVEGSGKLNLSSWREDLGKQLNPLVLGKIVHPSIPNGRPHRAYIVVNGELSVPFVHDSRGGYLITLIQRGSRPLLNAHSQRIHPSPSNEDPVAAMNQRPAGRFLGS